MPAGKTKIELLVEAKVREALKDLDKTEKGIDDLSKSGSRSTNTFKGAATAVKTFISALAIREIARFSLEVAKLGDQVNQVSAPFTKLVNTVGKDLRGALNELRGAVKGTISDLELMQIAASAMDAFTSAGMGATEAFEATQKTMDFLFRYSTKFGKDFSQLMQTVFKGLQRGSALFLDDVGIMISATDKQFEGLSDLAKKAKIVEVSLAQMAEKNELLGDVTEGATVKINRAAANFERFKIIIGDVLTGPVADALEFINKQFENLGINIDKILATGTEKELLEVQDQIEGVEEEIVLVNKNIELHSQGIGKWSAQLNKFFGKDKVAEYKDELVSLHQKVESLRAKEKQLQERLKKEIAAKSGKKEGSSEVQQEKKVIEAIQRLRLQAAITGAKNEYQAKLIQLEGWYELEKEKFKDNEEYQTALKATYEAQKSKIRQDILDHNQEQLQTALENEILLEIDAAERSQEIWEQRKENFISYARQVGYMFGPALNQIVSDLLEGTKKSGEIWKNFIDGLMADIRRFLADQAVKMFFNLLANALFPGSGNVFGSMINLWGGERQLGGPLSPGKIYTVGERGPEMVYQGQKGGFVMPLPQIGAPSPVASSGINSYTREIVEKGYPISGEVTMRGIFPEPQELRKFFIKVNRDVIIPDTDQFNQFNRTRKGEFDID